MTLKTFGITNPDERQVALIVWRRNEDGTPNIAVDDVNRKYVIVPEEENEAQSRTDISVFPLATPLIAGPGAISAVILLTTGTGGFTIEWFVVVGALLAILLLCYLVMLVAIPIQRLLGLTGLAVVSRVVGVLLAALAVQFLLDGIKASGLVGTMLDAVAK